MSALTELLERAGWTVLDGVTPLNVNFCKRCTHQILWCELPGGRRAPMDRNGERHPRECRVTIGAVRNRETGITPLRRCPYCSKETRYSPADLGLHIRAKHPIARTLPRSIDSVG